MIFPIEGMIVSEDHIKKLQTRDEDMVSAGIQCEKE